MDDAIDVARLREYCYLLEQASAKVAAKKASPLDKVSLHIKPSLIIEENILQSLVTICRKSGVIVSISAL